MARKHVTDKQCVEACIIARDVGLDSVTILQNMTHQVEKVCYRALERSWNRGLIEYGVSLRFAWPTEKGLSLF